MDQKSLEARSAPQQARGLRTVDAILDAAATLLMDIGLERLSTNMISERAGVAPPSFYRFFPNKYAVMKELADRLMAVQNAALAESPIDPADLSGSIFRVLKTQLDVTLDVEGGPAIMRSLYAAPVLRDVRLQSHEAAARVLLERFAAQKTTLSPDALKRRARLAVEVGYASLEHAFDAPKKKRALILKDAAHLLALYYQDAFER